MQLTLNFIEKLSDLFLIGILKHPQSVLVEIRIGPVLGRFYQVIESDRLLLGEGNYCASQDQQYQPKMLHTGQNLN